jgi:hypothetical protein
MHLIGAQGPLSKDFAGARAFASNEQEDHDASAFYL